MALKLIDSMYKFSAAAKQTATDKLRKILTRKKQKQKPIQLKTPENKTS